MSSTVEVKKRAGRPRKSDLTTARPNPDPLPVTIPIVHTRDEKSTRKTNRGTRRAVTESEANPWEHTAETLKLPKVISNDWAQIMLGDCQELIKQIPDHSVQLLYVDPPFAITMAKWDDGLNWPELWPEIWRVLKPNGCAVIHASQPFTFDLIASQRSAMKYMWTWKKSNKTLFPKANVQPLRQIEQICIFYKNQCTYHPQMVKGKPHMRGNPGHSQYYGDAFKKLGGSITNEYYPTDFIDFPLDELLEFLQQRDIKDFPFEEFATFLRDEKKKELPFPTDLLHFQVRSGRSFSRIETMAEYFVKTYTDENDTVLDICCSDGTTGVACRNTNRKFLGFDLSPKHFQLCAQRLGLIDTPAEPTPMED